MPTITHLDQEIIYDLKRTRRRRSIALQVDPAGTVTVLAPRFALGYFVDRFVRKQADWISKKLKFFEELRKKHPAKEFVSGETFPVWGREYRLKVVRDLQIGSPTCELVNGRLQVSIQDVEGSQANGIVKSLLKNWYTRQTEEKLKETLPRLTVVMGVAPANVKVVDQRKRWASCSRRGNLRFNWRLAMMPTGILDYVVLHELAHIKAHDHSKRFWNIVHSILPDFEKRRAWLRDNGFHLNV